MKRLPAIVTGIIFLFVATQKLQLGLVRYFDADEMAYLHWTHNVASGAIPYRDFLQYIPPLFLYAAAPLFWVVHDAAILAVSRMFAWAVFVGICVAGGFVLMRMRKPTFLHFLLPGIFLASLAVPADKFLEFRPDNLAMLAALVGLVRELDAVKSGKRRDWVWSGVWYAVSLLILPKTLPMIGVGMLMAMVSGGLFLFIGMAVPFAVFGVWVLATGTLPAAWYSVVRLPFEVNKLGAIYPMMPYQFFYPNALFYGGEGITPGFLANHGLWIAGLLTASVRLMTPYLPDGKRGARGELLVAASMLVLVLSFLYGYPMRHEQYLIPVAIFVAIYASDLLMLIAGMADRWRPLPKRWGVSMGGVTVVGLAFLLAWADSVTSAPKLAWTNAEDYRILREALATIPRDAYVFDLVGSTVYFRDPYYVSAVPFGQWTPYLSRPLPSVPDALEATRTRYVYEGRLGRVATLSVSDREYIRSHFTRQGDAGWFIR